eukprot:g28590.t1
MFSLFLVSTTSSSSSTIPISIYSLLHSQQDCEEEIGIGSSGYCQCSDGSEKLRARSVSCDHRPFRCATECLQAARYKCIMWRQTGGCSADGAREPGRDQPCRALIDSRSSGYCECGGGREIKQAFRKLSLVHHPDKTRNDPVLTARFAQIREAYDILGDEGQRAIYDSAGLQMLYQFLGNKAEKAPSTTSEVTVTLEQMYNGQELQAAVPRVLVCRGCAEAAARGVASERCRKCQTRCADEFEMRQVRMGNMIMQQQVQVPSKEKCRTQQHLLTIAVERGASAGDTVIFAHRGGQQPKKLSGDVIVKFVEAKHAVFRRAGFDLHTETWPYRTDALLGFERSIVHLDGRRLQVAFDGVTKPFAVMKVTGEGMPHKDPTDRGDLYIKCKIQMPEDGRQWLKEMTS